MENLIIFINKIQFITFNNQYNINLNTNQKLIKLIKRFFINNYSIFSNNGLIYDNYNSPLNKILNKILKTNIYNSFKIKTINDFIKINNIIKLYISLIIIYSIWTSIDNLFKNEINIKIIINLVFNIIFKECNYKLNYNEDYIIYFKNNDYIIKLLFLGLNKIKNNKCLKDDYNKYLNKYFKK